MVTSTVILSLLTTVIGYGFPSGKSFEPGAIYVGLPASAIPNMTMSHQRTGNASVSEATLIAFYDNALPISYTNMRQHARRAKHATLIAHHSDMMSQVRAEVNARTPAVNAFTASGGHHGGGGGGGDVGFVIEFGGVCYQDTYPMYRACIVHVSRMYLDVSRSYTSRYIKIHRDTFVS